MTPFGQDGSASVEGAARALRARARQRARQPPLADDGDGRPLPRRASSGAPCRTRRCAPLLDELWATSVAAPARSLRSLGRARRDLARRPRAQPLRRGAGALAARQGRRRGPRELDSTLYDLVDGLRAVAVALASYLPETAPADPRRARAAGRALLGRSAPTGSPSRSAASSRRRPSFPGSSRRSRPSDRHPRAPRRVRRARRPSCSRVRGPRASSRVVTIGSGLESCRARSTIAAAEDGRRRRARHPSRTRPAKRRSPTSRELRVLLADPQRGRGRRDRARLLPRLRAARSPARRSFALRRLSPPSSARPSSSTRGRPRTDTLAVLETLPPDVPVDPALLLVARPAAGGARAGLVRLVRRERHLPEGRGPASRGRPRPERADPRRDRLPRTSLRSPCAAGRTSRRTSCTCSTRSPRREARIATSSSGGSRRTQRRLFGCREPARVRPNRELGQHFLVDENILDVIGRLGGARAPTTSCSRSGPGLGVLTRYLAERVALVHAVEIDRALEPQLLESAPGPRQRPACSSGMRMALDLAGLDRRRRSSSPTCPTRSRRRSASRASTGSRARRAGVSCSSGRSPTASSPRRGRGRTERCPCSSS